VIHHLVETIPENCFSGCLILSHITFPSDSHLQKIEPLAFSGCGLESIQIPKGVLVLESGCFMTNMRLCYFTFRADWAVRQLNKTTLCLCASLLSICGRASVEMIGEL
jgi:hypothetical protein